MMKTTQLTKITKDYSNMKIRLYKFDFLDCNTFIPRFAIWWFSSWTVGYYFIDFLTRFVLTGEISLTPIAIRACGLAIFFTLLTFIQISKK